MVFGVFRNMSIVGKEIIWEFGFPCFVIATNSYFIVTAVAGTVLGFVGFE